MKKYFILFALVCFIPFSLFPESKLISMASLEGKTLQDIYLMRNEIYARYGRPFKTRELDLYFRSQKWYKLNLKFDESKMTKTDIENVTLLKQKEMELLKENYKIVDGKKVINTNNIINKWQFGEIKKEDLKKLSANGFLVFPGEYEQLFYIYENNTYLGIANFITTDTIMQLYHVFFDMTLRKIETEKLYPKIVTISEKMIQQSENIFKETKNPLLKEAAFRNKAFFMVPISLMGKASAKQAGDEKLSKIVKEEIGKCESHLVRENSLIFDPEDNKANKHSIDYTQFNPRGHYTRSEELKKYFKGMMWYGLNYFNTGKETDMLQALLITNILYKTKVGDKLLIDLWQDIYEPTAFFVGTSNDLGPIDLHTIIEKVWGKDYLVNDFTDRKKMDEASAIADEMYKKTRIKIKLEGISDEPQFRFMGQRYIPDSEILQRLSSWPERPFPKGLDIMAVMGSNLAKGLLLEDFKEGENWKKYPEILQKLTEQFGSYSDKEWKQNLYYNWFWCLKSLLVPDKSYTYPFFMNNDAWGLKSVNSVLASWAELRHDTILYGVQSGAECGDGEEWVPDPTKGFVEPNYIFFSRMEEMIGLSHIGLKKRDLMPKGMGEKFDKFRHIVKRLKDISLKELQGQPVSLEEHDFIMNYGAELESLSLSVSYDDFYGGWSELTNEVERNMAIIADVHTSQDNCLEEGVGPAFDIYTIVEVEGYLKLTRGAVFSYYEFIHPSSDRLTDEKWQKIIKEKKQPALPQWIQEYMSGGAKRKLPVNHTYGGCSGIYYE